MIKETDNSAGSGASRQPKAHPPFNPCPHKILMTEGGDCNYSRSDCQYQILKWDGEILQKMLCGVPHTSAERIGQMIKYLANINSKLQEEIIDYDTACMEFQEITTDAIALLQAGRK